LIICTDTVRYGGLRLRKAADATQCKWRFDPEKKTRKGCTAGFGLGLAADSQDVDY
jgi:hypothetical protein